MTRPLIGITVENVDNSVTYDKYESNLAYSIAVTQAGGLPLLLPQEVSLADEYARLCDGVMFTGGKDARSKDLEIPAHPEVCCIEVRRQNFEMALLDALAKRPQVPVLGVCLGMQLMALHAGGRLSPHLPDILANAVEEHQNNHPHGVVVGIPASALLASPLKMDREATPRTLNIDPTTHTVVSSHHQAVVDPGSLRIIAHSPDGVIEAIDDPNRPFYLGVQWHPERSAGLFNQDLIQRFVDACTWRHACLPQHGH